MPHTHNNVSIEFDPSGLSIKDLASRAEMLQCDSRGDLYSLRQQHHQALTAASVASLWHQQLGHPGLPVTSQILRSFSFQCNKADDHSCSSCRLGKHHRLQFSDSVTQLFFPFQLVHSDVWTSPTFSHSRFKYYVVFLDDYTHYLWVVPLHKSDVFHTIKSFISYVHTH